MQQAAVGRPLDCHPKIILEFYLNKEKQLIWTIDYFCNNELEYQKNK